jgi:hypothetical protein
MTNDQQDSNLTLHSTELELEAAREFVSKHLYFIMNQEQMAINLAKWHRALTLERNQRKEG